LAKHCLAHAHTARPSVSPSNTQIDLRFADRDEGNLVVVVAPVARFADIGFNAGARWGVCAQSR